MWCHSSAVRETATLNSSHFKCPRAMGELVALVAIFCGGTTCILQLRPE